MQCGRSGFILIAAEKLVYANTRRPAKAWMRGVLTKVSKQVLDLPATPSTAFRRNNLGLEEEVSSKLHGLNCARTAALLLRATAVCDSL